MADRAITVPAAMVCALTSGRKTQTRRLLSSGLAACRPGDRLWVREAFAPFGYAREGEPRDGFAAVRSADYAIMKDGWHQHRDGRSHADRDTAWDSPFQRARWAPATQMPRWASRLTLIVEAVRIERLQAIGRDDAIAEGLRPWPLGLGLFWRWPPPYHRRPWRAPVAAYRHYWSATRGTEGERWEDDPEVVVLRFRVVRGNIDAVAVP